MATNAPKKVNSLIVDAGPIIKNDPPVSTLISQAETLYTIPSVIEEIRDAVTRSRVESTLRPFLTLRTPSPASVKVITDFARRTGDLEVLSRPDIQLMALAYELECERNHGDWRLRSVPGQKRLNGAPPAAISGELTPQTKDGELSQSAIPSTKSPDQPKPNRQEPRGADADSHQTTKDEHNDTLEQPLSKTHISTIESSGSSNTATPQSADKQQPTPDILSETPEQRDLALEEIQISESEDSDGDGWITPSNLKKHQAQDANGSSQPEEEVKTMQVATLTSDFAMQNVLLRMNLNLLSPSLQRIRQLKTWVLRCHACFCITRDMSKQFCTRCGKPTLLRTSCSTDKDGNFKIHLKKNMQWNTRGNVYSVPKPVAGSANGKLVSGGGKGGWGQGLLLAEDQKEYVNAVTVARRKKEKDLMDEDYLPSILTGDRGGAGGRPKIGAGKNVNSKKRK